MGCYKVPKMKNMKTKIVLCHRKPERTFKIGEMYFPVCSRCTGLLLGVFFYCILFLYFFQFRFFTGQMNLYLFLLGILMILPTFLDGITQLFILRESNNILRFLSGFLASIGIGISIYSFLYYLYF